MKQRILFICHGSILTQPLLSLVWRAFSMWKNSIYNFFTTFENNDKEEPQRYYLFVISVLCKNPSKP